MSILRKPEEPRVEGDEVVIPQPEANQQPAPTEERKKLPKTKWF